MSAVVHSQLHADWVMGMDSAPAELQQVWTRFGNGGFGVERAGDKIRAK